MLRVGEGGLARKTAEEVRLERVELRQARACSHEVGVVAHVVGKRILEVCLRETRDGARATANVAPELADIVRAGEPSGEADDGDGVFGDAHCADLARFNRSSAAARCR